MVDLFRKKDEILDWKGNIESSASKYKVESIIHGMQKEYRNYNMSLLLPQ